MNIVELLANSADVKPVEKREVIAKAIQMKSVTIVDIQTARNVLNDKNLAIVFEAMEAVSGKYPELADLGWLIFVQGFVLSKSNSLKREASRIVGNIASMFPDDLETVMQYLMCNTKNESTVIRWGSAYALSRIIQIPKYANSAFYDVLTSLCVQEQETGVKNQLLNGLKKAKKLRK
ncbi:MAG: hypothetical protein FWC33_07540 [Candidatus Bathyarchaeota archaeon]|nr:hypothetical protein [Candidatus Termiticorpusculum sp.]